MVTMPIKLQSVIIQWGLDLGALSEGQLESLMETVIFYAEVGVRWYHDVSNWLQ